MTTSPLRSTSDPAVWTERAPRLALLRNPCAGRGRGARAAAAVGSALRARGASVLVVEGADDSRAAVREGAEALVAVGGDGTVHLAAQVLAGTATPLGIVPAGTGNDAARSLGVPMHPLAAVEGLLHGRSVVVDAVRVGSDRWYVGVLAGGFDARVNARAERMRWPRGPRRYDLAVLAELAAFRPLPYVLTLDGERWEAEAMLVAVGNTASYGGGLAVCHGAQVDDGLLDVLLCHRLTRGELLRLLPRVRTGSHLRHPAVEVRRARRVRLAAPGVMAYADGERIGSLPLDLECVPGALRVIVGAGRGGRPT